MKLSSKMRRNAASIAEWNETVRECKRIAKNSKLPNGATLLLENFFELDSHATRELHPAATCPFLGKEAWVNFSGR
jgi:hypothetical protein